MRREGFDTHLSSELFSMDRFEQSAGRVGLSSKASPSAPCSAFFNAIARLDTDALLRAYDEEIANAERVLVWMSSEQGHWSAESWAGVESLKANVRAGRDWLDEARARVQTWRDNGSDRRNDAEGRPDVGERLHPRQPLAR
jgi:hypothetical protein